MAEKYSDILNRSWDTIPKPKLLPVGSWLLRGRNVAFFPGNEDEEKSPRVVFFYEAREPMDDVSQQDLASLGEDYAYSENDIAKQFYINRNKDWDSVRKHLELHGVSTEGKNQDETFKAFKGTEVISYLGTKTYTNAAGQTIEDNDPQSFAAVS